MEEIMKEEQNKLDETEKIIDLEIIDYLANEEEVKKEALTLTYEDRLRGTHFNLNSQLYNIGENIARLKRAKDCPYFGRIDYQDLNNREVEKIYIGKSSIVRNGENAVYDWRSPICGLYYDSEIGIVSYKSPTGTQVGRLKLKRQILIKNSELLNVVDTNLVTNDELLLPYLNVNADDRMKTIIASIQKEQNSIIRKEDNNIIVQGVAGSGKTSVALHRIAYLMYLMEEKAKNNNFLVIGPNDYFLNYISSVLPELETTSIEQKTLLSLMNEYLNINLTLNVDSLSNNKKYEQMQKNISSFKGSFEFLDLLNNFIKECFEGKALISEDFKIDGKTIFSADRIREELLSYDGKTFSFDRTVRRMKAIFKDNKENIFYQLNKEYKKMYLSLPKNDPLIKEYVNKSVELERLVKVQGEKLLDKYFKNINKNGLSLYVLFISNLDKCETSLTDDEIKILQTETLKNIRKKQIKLEDISPILYLNYMFTNNKFIYKNLVVDEAQDYSMFTYFVLKKLFPNAKFNLYGDLAQNIYPYRGIKSWSELNEVVFDNKFDILELSKSYRTTIEITETANNILNLLQLTCANPVIRHGSNVEYIDVNNYGDIKINKICEWINNGYHTIAVICKNDNEAKKVQNELISNGINSKYISNKDSEYTEGVFVLSVESAKGLEFDCTIINNASSKNYDSENEVDMHLLYVASTRALHEQLILYNKEITKPFKNEVKNVKVLKKTK